MRSALWTSNLEQEDKSLCLARMYSSHARCVHVYLCAFGVVGCWVVVVVMARAATPKQLRVYAMPCMCGTPAALPFKQTHQNLH